MYRGKKYRIGGGGSIKKPAESISTISENLSTISSASKPPITSTPKPNEEPVAGPSNVLTERENLPSQSQASQRQAVIFSNDNDFIPPSQTMQPSRYISQRSALLRSQLTFTQQTPTSYFEGVLKRCGVELTARNSEISYAMNCDHLKFVIRLRKELTSHLKYPENVQTFLSGLIDAMKNQTQLTKILSGCMVIIDLNTCF